MQYYLNLHLQLLNDLINRASRFKKILNHIKTWKRSIWNCLEGYR